MMKFFLCTLLLLSGCSLFEKKNEVPFSVTPIIDDKWATFEGRWKASDAVVFLELSLEAGSVGVDSRYKLLEAKYSDKRASGTTSQNTYSTYYGKAGKEIGILLHDLDDYEYGSFLRHSSSFGKGDEMFFLTHGSEELIPCDNEFKPLTNDWHYTLHKRSRPFTVEGYVTFEKDSASFYERNAMQKWKLAELGEFDDLKTKYIQLAKKKIEGIYLKALAYSVKDQQQKDVLVIKRIIDAGNDPD